jgi:hypothetical protein
VQLLYFSNLGLCKLVGILENELLGLVHYNSTTPLPPNRPKPARPRDFTCQKAKPTPCARSPQVLLPPDRATARVPVPTRPPFHLTCVATESLFLRAAPRQGKVRIHVLLLSPRESASHRATVLRNTSPPLG